MSETGGPVSVWASLAELLNRILDGFRPALPGVLGLAVCARDPLLASADLEVLGGIGVGLVLAPIEVHRYGGPVVAAAEQRQPVISADLWGDPRWPELTAAQLTEHAPEQADVWARLVGMVAVPGQAAGGGVLVLSASFDHAPDADVVRVLTQRLSLVTAAVGVAAAAVDTRQHVEDTMSAMRGRVVIEQAKGLVMAVRGCPSDEAWTVLRRASQQFNVKLRELAVALVEHVGAAPTESAGDDDPPGVAVRRAAQLTWQALRLPGPAGAPARRRRSVAGVDPALPQSGTLRIDPLESAHGLRVRGEVDATVHDRWKAALERAAGEGRDVQLDLSELRFIDGRGAAILVDTAKLLPAGREMVLRQPPAVLRRVLDLLWPEGTATIAIKDDSDDGDDGD